MFKKANECWQLKRLSSGVLTVAKVWLLAKQRLFEQLK